MSCKSAIYSALQTSSTVTVSDASGATLPLGATIRRFGCNLGMSGNGIIASGCGYYRVAANVTITPATAGTYTLGLLKDGMPVPGAMQVAAVAAGTPASLEVGALVRNQCCGETSTLTLSLTAATTPATVTVDNVAVMAERI